MHVLKHDGKKVGQLKSVQGLNEEHVYNWGNRSLF